MTIFYSKISFEMMPYFSTKIACVTEVAFQRIAIKQEY